MRVPGLRLLWLRLTAGDGAPEPEGPPQMRVERSQQAVEDAARRLASKQDTARREVAALGERIEQEIARPLDAKPSRFVEASLRFEALHERYRRDVTALRQASPPAPVGAVRTQDRAAHVRRLEEPIARLEDALAELERARDTERGDAERWQRDAEHAVETGRDDLALDALTCARGHRARGVALTRELEAGRAMVSELRAALKVRDHELPRGGR